MNLQKYRKSKYNKGQVTLTDRDHRVLRWISEQQAARFDQVQWLLGQDAGRGALVEGEISASAARQVIARWRQAGWIIQKKVFFGEPPWLWPTARLLRLLELPYKACEPSFVRLVHICAVNEVRLSIEDIWPDYQWISERQIRASFSSGASEKAVSLPHLPDAKLITDSGIIIIEVELSSKSSSTLRTILEELSSTYATVWYFAEDQARSALEAARNKLDPALAANVYLYSYSLERGTDTTEDWAC
jgi:hypothetical protein